MMSHSHKIPEPTGTKKSYTVEQINHFLDVTTNVHQPRVKDFFPPRMILSLISCSAATEKSFP